MPWMCKHVLISENGLRRSCRSVATRCIPGERPSRCISHMLPGMKPRKRVDRRICKADGCKTRSTFNKPGESRGIYCCTHADRKTMVNVVAKKCTVCKSLQPTFGPKGKRPTHCAACRIPGLVDLVRNLCEVEACQVNACFAYIGEKVRRCKKHILKDMYDLKNCKCVGCIAAGIFPPKQATYGLVTPTSCKDHKGVGHKDLRHDAEMCTGEHGLGGCATRATYGKQNQKPEKCKEHRLLGMYDLVRQMCENCGLTQPVYNIPGETQGRFCSDCKSDGMENVVAPRCRKCGLFQVHNKDLCRICTPEGEGYQKTKENLVVANLREHKLCMVLDKPIARAYGCFRPDILIKCDSHELIVEVDENQHAQYPKLCEISRMLAIQSYFDRPCIFIRYNPDNFRVNGKITDVSQHDRLRLLRKTIDKYTHRIPKDPISVYRLYYNEKRNKGKMPCFRVKYKIGKAIERLYRHLRLF